MIHRHRLAVPPLPFQLLIEVEHASLVHGAGVEVSLAAAAGGEAGGVVGGLLRGEGGVEGGRGSWVGGLGFVACAAAANADGGGVGGVGFADVEGGGEGHCCRW